MPFILKRRSGSSMCLKCSALREHSLWHRKRVNRGQQAVAQRQNEAPAQHLSFEDKAMEPKDQRR